MRRLIQLAFFLVLCAPLLAQHTYYISKSIAGASDSNTSTQAQSKTTPWKHLPGMNGCTSGGGCSILGSGYWGGCCYSPAGYLPVAGDRFILYGGDTWVASDLGMSFDSNGTSGSPIYIGVDTSWYNSGVCGASFCRPIFNAQGSVLSSNAGRNMLNVYADWVTVDNIEFTGFATSGGVGSTMIVFYSPTDTLEHLYMHGWSHAGSGDGDYSFAISGSNAIDSTPGGCVQYNVIDGSDTSQDMIGALQSFVPCVIGNVLRYVTNGIQGSNDNVHDNWIGPIVLCYDIPFDCHQNMLGNFGPALASHDFFYNNVLTNGFYYGGVEQTGSGAGLGVCALTNSACSVTTYIFNNVIFQNSPFYGSIAIGWNQSSGTGIGTYYVFNNTIECGRDGNLGTTCIGGGAGPPSFTATIANNHIINSSGSGTGVSCLSGQTCTLTTDLVQSVSTANGQGYTSAETYAFSPASGSGSTVAAGTNKSSICTSINSVDTTAGTACQNSTGYACSYNTSNHTVTCPNDTENARGSTWDIGAYQFSGSPAPSADMTFTGLHLTGLTVQQ